MSEPKEVIVCDICNGEVPKVVSAFDGQGNKCMACQNCIDRLDVMADAAYERQKEEGNASNPA